jgi:hypothetical protein
MKCPASIPLSEGQPDTTSVYAEEGTAAHEVCEMILRNQDLPETLNGFEVSKEMIEHCMVYTSYIEEQGLDAEVSIEERVDLSHIEESMFGTSDADILKPFESLEIVDFKYGQGMAVEAVNNSQLMYYALGRVRGNEVERIKMTIVQPRAIHPDGPIRSWEISYSELMEWEQELKEAVERVNETKKVHTVRPEKVYDGYTKSGSHCKFCKAAGFCKTLRDESMAVAKSDFDDVEIVLPSPSELTKDELGKALASSDMLEGWIKAVKLYAFKQAEGGHKIEGYKLVKKKANRKWKDESEMINEFEDIMGDKLFEKKLLTPAKLEKIIGKDEVKKHTFTPDSGTTLVPIKDKRKEVKPQIEEDFTDI